MRQGDFSELLGAQVGTDGLGRPIYQNQIYDPATTRSFGTGFIRDPFSYQGRLNVIDPARFSKVSQAFQKGYPLPNRPGTQNNLSWTPRAADYNSDIITGKIDHQIGSKHRLNFGFDHSLRNENINWNDRFLEMISPILTSTFPQYRYRFKYYWTPTNTVVFNFNAATTRVPNRYGGQRGYASENYGCEAGLKGYLVCNTPYVGIAQGITGFGYPHPGNFDAEQGTPIEGNLAWTKGTHSLKFGVQHHTQIKRTVDRESSSASINFERQETGLPSFGTTGMGYASFLLGAVDNAQMRYPSEYKMVSGAWAFYAQDQWRLTRKFTLNYGLRWDIFTPHREADDEIGGFDPTIPNPAAGGRLGALTFWGAGTGRNGRRLLYDYYYKAFGPRIGFVYEIMPKTILRAYYGITYPPRFGQFTSGANAPRAGYSASLEPRSFDNGVTPAYYWDQPWPQTFPALPRIDPSLLNGTSIGYVDVKRAAEVAKFHNINVGLERELPGQIGIRANYVGLLSYNLPARALHPLNQLDAKFLSLGNLLLRSVTSPEAIAAGIALPYPGFTGTVAQALRPYPQFQDIPDLGVPVGKNTYHSLQVNFDKRWGQGLTFVAGYTLSKTLNNGRYQNQGWLNSNYAQHYSILNTAYVLGELDRTHNLVVNYSYELPFGPGKRFGQSSSGVLRHVIGGWRISASQFYMSGLPIDLSSDQRNPVSIGGGWVNRVPGVPIRTSFGRNLDPNDPSQRYLNVAAFQVPAQYTFGNTFRLPDVRQPPYFNENVAFAKRFTITEQTGLEFGANCFNLFNRHMLWNMQGNIQNSNFGRFSRASDPRTIQFYLRLTY